MMIVATIAYMIALSAAYTVANSRHRYRSSRRFCFYCNIRLFLFTSNRRRRRNRSIRLFAFVIAFGITFALTFASAFAIASAIAIAVA